MIARTPLLALVAGLLLTTLAPPAAGDAPSCASVTSAGATPYGPYLVRVFGPGTVHEVWAETNLVEGLQRVECVGADGALVAPDQYVTKAGVDTGGQPICVPRLGCIF